ncbi:MAG: BNR-repeat neuraminidase N-terminal domain-containing protein [Planctomycetaceae bacterium]
MNVVLVRPLLLVLAAWIVIAPEPARGVETFEAAQAGPLTAVDSSVGRWTAHGGAAEIHAEHAHAGRHSLRLIGGDDAAVELALPAPLATSALLAFWAERWTAARPFRFTIEACDGQGRFSQVHDAGDVKTGGFLTRVEARIPAGTTRLAFRATTPPGKGVMIDDVSLEEEGPMLLVDATATRPACPVLTRKPVNPVVGIVIRTRGTTEPLAVRSLAVSLEGTTVPADVTSVALATGDAER